MRLVYMMRGGGYEWVNNRMKRVDLENKVKRVMM